MGRNPGRLERKVKVQEKSRTSDGGGGSTVTWTDLTNPDEYVRLRPLQGGERLQAMQLQGPPEYECVMRRRTDITRGMSLLEGSTRYLIVSPPVNEDERREYLTFLVREEVT